MSKNSPRLCSTGAFPASLPTALLRFSLSIFLPFSRRPPHGFVWFARSIRLKRGVWPVDIVEPHPRTLFISSAEAECQEGIFSHAASQVSLLLSLFLSPFLVLNPPGTPWSPSSTPHSIVFALFYFQRLPRVTRKQMTGHATKSYRREDSGATS